MKTLKSLLPFFMGMVFFFCLTTAGAQSPPRSNNGNSNSHGGTPVGGNAPVGSGLVFLLTLASLYASKTYLLRKSDKTIS